MLIADFHPDLGYVRIDADSVPQGEYIQRVNPLIPEGYGNRREITNFDYVNWSPRQTAADVLAPLGTSITYGLAPPGSTAWSDTVTIDTPIGNAYLRHLFYPSLGGRVNVVLFDDARPSRLTTYMVSGQRNQMATWDVRAGRDAELVLLLRTRAERDRLEATIADGAPISLAMCSKLGNDPGIFAVGDVQFTRYGTRDRWTATLQLTEVDMPRILADLPLDQIPPVPQLGVTYDDREAELAAAGGTTYRDAAARWNRYYQAAG